MWLGKVAWSRGVPPSSKDGTAAQRARLARSMMVEQLAIVGNGEGTTCSVLYRSHDTIADPARDSTIS